MKAEDKSNIVAYGDGWYVVRTAGGELVAIADGSIAGGCEPEYTEEN